MSLELFAHPFSSYCQKVLVALYENATPFTLPMLDFGDTAPGAEFAVLWPLQRMPLLCDGERLVVESSVIIEHLDLFQVGPVRLVPDNPKAALAVRFLDACSTTT